MQGIARYSHSVPRFATFPYDVQHLLDRRDGMQLIQVDVVGLEMLQRAAQFRCRPAPQKIVIPGNLRMDMR